MHKATIKVHQVALVAMVLLVQHWYISNMWALVDKNTNIVLACIHNKKLGEEGHTYEEALEIAGDNILVEMTLENTPAFIDGRYDGVKFYEPESDTNG
jgi:hypothetical protein